MSAYRYKRISGPLENDLRTIFGDWAEIEKNRVLERRQKEYREKNKLRIDYAKILNEHFKKNNYGHQLFKKINISKKEEEATDDK